MCTCISKDRRYHVSFSKFYGQTLENRNQVSQCWLEEYLFRKLRTVAATSKSRKRRENRRVSRLRIDAANVGFSRSSPVVLACFGQGERERERERENSSDSPAGERWDPLSRRPQRSYRRVGEGCVAADPTTTRAFLHRCTGASRCSSASSRSGLRVTRPRLGSQRKRGACVGRRRQLADSFRAATPSGTASVWTRFGPCAFVRRRRRRRRRRVHVRVDPEGYETTECRQTNASGKSRENSCVLLLLLLFEKFREDPRVDVVEWSSSSEWFQQSEPASHPADESQGIRERMTRQTSDDRVSWVAMIASSKDPRVIKRGFQRGCCIGRAFDATLAEPRLFWGGRGGGGSSGHLTRSPPQDSSGLTHHQLAAGGSWVYVTRVWCYI